MKGNKMTMCWLQFIVWVITILCTIILNRDVAVLSIVSGVFIATNSWLFHLHEKEKENGVK